jgi:hypothetical protein
VAGAATAVAVGLFALSAINLQPASQGGLPQIPAVSAGTAEPSPSPATSSPPGPSATPPSSAGAAASVDRVLTSAGGSVIARCLASGAYLVSWTPAQGYKAEDVRRGPAGTARLKFEYHDGGEYVMSVQCANGIPQAVVSRKY